MLGAPRQEQIGQAPPPSLTPASRMDTANEVSATSVGAPIGTSD
jgi:hypothetical protein